MKITIILSVMLALLTLLYAVSAFAGVSSHGLAMYGDLKYSANFKHFDYVNPNAPKDGKITLISIGTFDNLNPFILKGVPADGVGLLFETLTLNSDDEPFSVYGLLAEIIETPSDRSWVAFTLRKEARWHDGSSVVADDVIFSFNKLVKEGHPFYRMYYAGVDKAIKVSNLKVKFTFKPGSNRELPLIVGQLPIIQKKYYTEHEFNKTTLEFPIGSGPYKVSDINPGRSITYERVPDYWGKDIPVRKGTYNFDIVKFEYYRDEVVALEAFKSGEADFRMENTAKTWATAYQGRPFKKGYIIKEELPNENPTGMQAFIFNTRRELFKDKRVRQALAYMFDFEWTNRSLFYGTYTRTRSYFSNSDLASVGLPSKEEMKLLEPFKNQLPEEVFTKVYEPPVSTPETIRNNMTRALELLNQADWIIKDNILTNIKTGRRFEFEILLMQPGFERICMPFIQNLEKFGIKMEIRMVDSSQYINRLNAFDFDMIVETWGQSLSPGNEQRDFWSSEAADMPGTRNYAGIKDPVIDYLIEKVIQANTRQELITACRALDRVLLWGHYSIPQWHINSYRIAYWNIFSRPSIKPKYSLGFLDTWWYDKEKAGKISK